MEASLSVIFLCIANAFSISSLKKKRVITFDYVHLRAYVGI